MLRTPVFLALALMAPAMAGCHVGPRAESFGPALSPEGAVMALTMADSTRVVELLAVSDSGLVVTHASHVAFAPYGAISVATLRGFNELFRTEGHNPDAKSRERLRLVSRFPQGVSSELLATLLALHAQRSMDVLK